MTRTIRGLVVACLLVLVAGPARAQEPKKVDLRKKVIQEGNADLLTESLDPMSFAKLNAKELRILRNTIFAHHGYVFKSGDLTKHFEGFAWYQPSPAANERLKRGELLTEAEKKNIALTKNLEKLRKGKGRELVAGKTFNCGAASTDYTYNFCEDGKAAFSGSFDPQFGTWRLEGSVIVIHWTQRRRSKDVGRVMGVTAEGPSYEKYVHHYEKMNETQRLDWLETQSHMSDCGFWSERDLSPGEPCEW